MSFRRCRTLVLPVAAAALAFGCAPTPPIRADPFADLGVKSGAPAAYPTLSLGVVATENSSNTLAYLRQWAAHAANAPGKHPFDDPDQFTKNLTATLRNQFKSVVTLDSAAQAASSGVDLIARVDFFAELPGSWPLSSPHKIDETVLFLDPSGNTVEKIAVSVSKIPREVTPSNFSFGGGNDRIEATIMIAFDAVAKEFSERLAASEALHSYAKRRGNGAPAAAQTASVPSGPQPKGGSSAVDTPSYKMDEDPTKYALIVGVENYESLPPADYAERDASAVRRHLLALGYPERNVIYLTGPAAGKSGIEKYVESWLPRNVGENGQVFVYFSGHGAPDTKTGEAYLVPWDGDAKFLENTGYPLKRLYERLARLKATKVIVALDSCFSGAGGRSVLAKGARPLVTQIDTALPASNNLVVLAAASGDEITGTDEDQGHGLFTYYLLKGLNDRGGSASVQSLYDLLKPRVQDAARRDNRDQTPQLLPSAGPANTKL